MQMTEMIMISGLQQQQQQQQPHDGDECVCVDGE